MWLKWLPWRFLVRRAARAQGFVDPIAVLSHLHRFAQPSEVAAPLELLRAGVVFHARGLMNTGAIQHNLDWVWPYWVERQFNPADESFIPRAFSITHVNLTHRNWTALGLPDCDWLPLVDPRGLLTPTWDGWSLDCWVIDDDGGELIPSRSKEALQRLDFHYEAAENSDRLAVITDCETQHLGLRLEAEVVGTNLAGPVCRQRIQGTSERPGWLVVSLRPYNSEGVRFVHDIALDSAARSWSVDGAAAVRFDQPVERHLSCSYQDADVHRHLRSRAASQKAHCDVGMATAAAMFRLQAGVPRQIGIEVPLTADADQSAKTAQVHGAWPETLRGACQMQIPDEQFQFLYDAALRTLILHSPGDVYPGPYTYKRFWFRDAAYILYALLCAGFEQRAVRCLNRFPSRQTRQGYFRSQEGEWDSNGEALWIMERYCTFTGRMPPEDWRKSIAAGAEWIVKKRLSDAIESPCAGLLPAGFSAEHLGPNDYYYWDDFWGIAGLQSAARLATMGGDPASAQRWRLEAERFMASVERSLEVTASLRNHPGIPAAPTRRMDAGAIGSIVAGYPLQLWPSDDSRLTATTDFLAEESFYAGGFFQDMIHSGINAYLTLHVAQVDLRAGNPRYFDHLQAVARLASPTGQWPEAIHPRTLGGCMGDGQHVWAAAEWLLMMRSLFVREENDRLILGSGIPQHWLASSRSLRFGPTPTSFGPITVVVTTGKDEVTVDWHGRWHAAAPAIEIRLPCGQHAFAEPGADKLVVKRLCEAER
jgi:hypothetical protein